MCIPGQQYAHVCRANVILCQEWQLHVLSSCVWCLQLNLALVGLLNVSLALEDPFDNQGLDGIYVDEALFEAEQVRAR